MKLTSEILLASMFAAVTSVIAGASAAEVTGARVTGLGEYRCEKTVGHRPSPGNPTNDVDLSEGCQLVRPTTTIQAKLGTTFGCEFIVGGVPNNADVAVATKWVFPKQGLMDPSAGRVHFWANNVHTARIGQTKEIFYKMEEPWELVPGAWALEIRNGDRKLAECRFDVVVP